MGFADLGKWLMITGVGLALLGCAIWLPGLVAGESRVLPARLFGHKSATTGRVEALLLRPAAEQPAPAEGQSSGSGPAGNLVWEALVKPGRSIRPGTRLVFSSAAREGRPGP